MPEIKKDCISTIRYGLKKKNDITLQQKRNQINEQIKQVSLVHEKIDPKTDKWKIPDNISEKVHEKMAPLKSMAIKLMKTSDYEIFNSTIYTIRDISISYLQIRQDYKTFYDHYLFLLAETFKDLIKNAERYDDINFNRNIFKAIRDIALSTLSVQVLGSKSGYNYLTTTLSSIFHEIIREAVIKIDLNRSYDAAKYFGETGEKLAIVGAGHSASDIANQLNEIAKICIKLNDITTLVPIRNSLAEIYYNLLRYRKIYPNYDFPYKKILEVYNAMLDIPLDSGTALSIGDPMFGWNPDLSEDRSLSSLIYIALYSPNINKKILKYNIEEVDRIVKFILDNEEKDNINTNNFQLYLYQIGLWLLAFIDNKITSRMILFEFKKIPKEEDKETVKVILSNIIKFIQNRYFNSLNGSKKTFDEEELLHSLLSIMSLALYLESKHKIDFNDHIFPILKDFNEQLKSIECELSLTTYNNIERFCIFLKKINQTEISQQLNKIYSEKKININRIDPLNNFDIIKRPIIAFENRLFVEFDKNILGRN
ncbi:MAG: hypothetical protein KKC53_07210 [Actinobacteria bacterium]|nr:hypothetical protein [Actinomycetota bacterium]